MAANKVILNGTVLIDLTADTATAEDVAEGKMFHLASGEVATGSAKSSGGGGTSIEGGYTVTFMANDSVFASFAVMAGNSVAAPREAPAAGSGKNFLGWSATNGGTTLVEFPFTPTANTTLYAVIANATTIVGFTGLTNSSGELTWTDSIADLQSQDPYTTSTSGNYVSVTGALDDVFPFNQIQEVEDDNSNIFIRFPKMWIKWVNDTNGNIDGIKVADSQVDEEYFLSDAYLKPDGSSYNDYFEMGKYEASGSSSRSNSRSGATPLVNLTRSESRTSCRYYGTADNHYNGYQQLDLQMLTLYNFLCMMFFRTSNIQTVYAGRTNSNSANATGSTNGVTGLNGWNTSTYCVKMLGVENPYGNVYKWCDGVRFSDTTIYVQRNSSEYSDSAGGTAAGFSRPSTNNWIAYLRQGQSDATKSVAYAENVNGASASLYVGDYCYYHSSGAALYVGGAWGDGSRAGLWYLYGDYTTSYAYSYLGGRLCHKPL